MDFLLIAIIWLLGFIAGWWSHKNWIQLVIKKMLDHPDLLKSTLERYRQEDRIEDDEDTKPLKVERHGDMIYLYNNETGEFLAQAPTLQEALDLVSKRFPNQNFKGHLDKEEADALGVKI